jgi:hypothetical protein
MSKLLPDSLTFITNVMEQELFWRQQIRDLETDLIIQIKSLHLNREAKYYLLLNSSHKELFNRFMLF